MHKKKVLFFSSLCVGSYDFGGAHAMAHVHSGGNPECQSSPSILFETESPAACSCIPG